MCVITYKPENVLLSKEEANLMWETNSHGAGFAFYDPAQGRWVAHKGFMGFPAFWEAIEPYAQKGHKVVAHFRLASVGSVVPELTHPFPLKVKEGEGYLFHNGTFFLRVPQKKSDSQLLSEELSLLKLTIEELKVLVSTQFFKSFLGHSKLALLLPQSPDPVLLGSWERTVGGLIVSNRHWEWGWVRACGLPYYHRYSRYSQSSKQKKKRRDWEDWYWELERRWLEE